MPITGYCVKCKEKGVPMLKDPVDSLKQKKVAIMAKGACPKVQQQQLCCYYVEG